MSDHSRLAPLLYSSDAGAEPCAGLKHDCSDLIALFDQCFYEPYNTRLVRGEDEPIYTVAGEHCRNHQIIFAHGFFRSALHESAHWLVAGEHRRTLEDYGYWYEPDGRTVQQQQEFERVEVRPQAIEWILTKACMHPFAVSVDNLSGEATDAGPFKQAVFERVLHLQKVGLSTRAEAFRLALAHHYGTPASLTAMTFDLQELA